MTLAAVLMFGATFAMAEGILVSDTKTTECTQTNEGIIVFGAADGIIVFGSAQTGIIVFGAAEGIIVFGGKDGSQCTEKNGILVSDRNGILVSD